MIVIGSITVRNIAVQVQANNTTILIAEAEKTICNSMMLMTLM